MAKIRTLQLYRGTTAQNNAYTGSAGELTMDTTTNELRLHDGSTVGGHIIGSGGGGGSGYHPDLFDCKWADHICNDVQWLRADTFSWQSGAVYEAAYQHLLHDMDTHTITGGGVTFTRDESKDGTGYYAWTNGITLYTASDEPVVGDTAYAYPNLTVPAMTIDSVSYNAISQTETVAGTTITYYLADDGHKICLADQESNVSAIYTATGVAWYYILDTVNQRFKLPRRHSQQIVRSVKNADGSWYRLYADGWVEQGSSNPVATGTTVLLPVEMADSNYIASSSIVSYTGTNAMGADIVCITKTTTTIKLGNTSNWQGVHFIWEVKGMAAIDMSSFQDSEKYLYFYVGNFTQTALENTAGLNAELFNGKADIDLSNTPMATADYVVETQLPTAQNNYTWYRKYKSGWVEQGAYNFMNGYVRGAYFTVTLPITMADADYTVILNFESKTQNYHSGTDFFLFSDNYTTTGFHYLARGGDSNNYQVSSSWEVSGMAAQ